MSQETDINKAGGPSLPPASRAVRWRRFIIAVVLLACFIWAAPMLERIPVVGEKIADLRESGINVGAWYYDDVEEYFEAEDYIRDKMNKP